MIINTVTHQQDGRNVRGIILKSSWHTYLENSKSYIFILHKVKKPPDEFCNYTFFASAIILIFGVFFT